MAANLIPPVLSAGPTPPVTFSVQPEEGGKIVYLQVPKETAAEPASNLLGLRLHIANNAATEKRLNTIRVSFPGFPGLAQQFERDLEFASGQSKTEYLTPDEAIRLPEPPPPQARVELFFDGYAFPKVLQRALAPYEGPDEHGAYIFPANARDLAPDQYFSNIPRHTGGGQFFGYDMSVYGWNAAAGKFSSVIPGGDPATNEDRVGWGMPLYAMADGVVIRASTGWENNPAPGKRALQRMGDYSAGAIEDVKVTKLSETRAASVVRLPSGRLKVIVWDANDHGREIIRRGSLEGEVVGDVATDALTSSRLITAVRTQTGNLRIIVWGISADGETVTRLGERDAGKVEELTLVKLSTSRFATAVRTQEGALRLIVWSVSSNGQDISILAHEFAGDATCLSTVALSSSRLITALKATQGTLKVIVWDIVDGGGTTILRQGSGIADAISKVVAVKASSSSFATAMRTTGGDLKLIRWQVSEDGQTVIQLFEVDAGPIQDLAAAAVGFDEAIITSVVTPQQELKNIVWLPDLDAGAFKRWGEAEAGEIDRFDIDVLDSGLALVGVRTAGGTLKLISWWVGHGGGNNLVILHGNCRMLYAHMVDGSVNPDLDFAGATVVAGQFLGRLGNSGSSEGPHVHISADRVSSFLSTQEIIDLEAQDSLPSLGYRPIPFEGAVTMRLDAIQPGGPGNPANDFTPMQGHGPYFARFGILPTW